MLQYLLKFSISLTVLYIFYRAVLRPLTFYQWNRFYLLCYSLLSFVIPFIDITSWMHSDKNKELVNIIPAITSYNYTISQPAPAEVKLSLLQRLTVTDWLLIIFVLGVLVMTTKLIVQYLSLRNIRNKAVLIDSSADVKLYETMSAVSPFSFGNAIYFNRQLHTDDELQRIIQHEFVHVKQKHTIDLLVGEMLCVVNWFNPFAWFIRYSIRQNLEFIADNNVVANGLDKKEYQYLLLKVLGVPQYSIANNFNFSNLKKRIAMMNKMKSAKLHLTRFLFVLPLLVVLLLAFRNKMNDENHRKTYVLTGIVYDAKTDQPLAGVAINETYSGLRVQTNADGFFKLKIPIGADSIFKVNCNFRLAGYLNKDSQNLWFSPVKVKTTTDLVFAGMRKQNNSSYDGLTVSTHYQIPVNDEKQFIADPDYSFVQQKFIAFQDQKRSSDKIDQLIKDSKKPIWIIDGAVYAIGNASKAWFSKEENVAPSSFVVWVDGKLMSMDEANALVNRFEVFDVGAVDAENAVKKFGVKMNVLALYWKTKPAPVRSADTIPPPPVPAVPLAKITMDFAPQPVNQQGYILSIADNHGECIVVIKDKSQKIVKAQLLAEWNKDKEANESHYGKIPSPPPPPPQVNLDFAPADQPLAPVTIDFAPAVSSDISITENLPSDVSGIVTSSNIDKKKGTKTSTATVTLKNGKKEIYNLNKPDEKAKFIEKYGKQPEIRFDAVPPLPAAPTSWFQNKDTTKNPLFIIDGIEQPQNFAPNSIDAAKISSVNVLKGQEAVAVFGAKASAGAILVTMRKPSDAPAKMPQPVGISAIIEKLTLKNYRYQAQPTETIKVKAKQDTGYFPKDVLVIIDGKEIPAGSKIADYVQPENIEGVVLLTDKTATDLYGDKGKNGVIVITKKAAQLEKKQNKIVTLTADKITWDKQHLVITGGSVIQDGQTSLINGDMGFDSEFSSMPMVVYNGRQVTNFNSFKLAKVKISILSLNIQESIAKYGPVAKNGAVEITKL